MSPRPRMRRWLLLALPLAAIAALVLLAERDGAALSRDWRAASRDAIGLAPDPRTTREAVVQVYAARAVRWRGYFGVHTWIAAKPAGGETYTVYEVNGWRLRRSGNAITISDRPADGRWFGNAPMLLTELRGPAATAAIPRIEAAVHDYPYAGAYRVWPGPNSNTFTAYVLRAVPDLRGDLPATAIGKDYLPAPWIARSLSGTGWQFNVYGVLGVLAGLEEGLELNLLGLTVGIDPNDLALELPLAGTVSLRGMLNSTDRATLRH